MLTNSDISKIKSIIQTEIDTMQNSVYIWSDAFATKHPGEDVDELNEKTCDISKAMYEWASGSLRAYQSVKELIETYEETHKDENA